MERPDFISHWSNLEGSDNRRYSGNEELLSIGAPVGRLLGLTKLGIHHERLPPGRRTSYPHAESGEDEFVFIIEGMPEVWVDGYLHQLGPGDCVAFPSGTGIAHTFINNTNTEVRLLVVGETNVPNAKIHYPLNIEYAKTRSDIWLDPPSRPLGPHDGHPSRMHQAKDR
jgi:uncharacterized cupin superfamily protein